MREGIGGIVTYNIVIMFLLIVFALIAITLSYFKAFRVNSYVISSIEKYEGYNRLSVVEADRSLKNIGYRVESNFKCPDRKGRKAMDVIDGTNHRYCVYKTNHDKYRSYGVVTYINFDLPIVGLLFRVPIYSESIMLYNFG